MTIAQQLKVKDFPFIIKDKNGNLIYCENSIGYWSKNERDSNGKEIYFEDSTGYWSKKEYDANGKEIYWEDSYGYWSKHEYDVNGKVIYYENSRGDIKDNRPKIVEMTLQQIADKLGINVTQLRIKD
jgi:hypothetical protein